MTAAWFERTSEAIAAYDLQFGEITLLTLSENATFLIDAEVPVVLRIHRPGFRSQQEIESEIAWVEALRVDGVVPTPRTIPDRAGQLVTTLPGGGTALLMEAVPGVTADVQSAVEVFNRLGAVAARMHAHADRFSARTPIVRPTFDLDTVVGPACPYGTWRDALPADSPNRDLIEQAERLASERITAATPRRGLIHGDMRAANLLVDDDRLTVIDFDDCGWGWRFYELACALSFVEMEPSTPEAAARWLGAYLRELPDAAADVGVVPDLILLRRLLLVAWLAARSHTAEARDLSASFTADTAEICRLHLDGRFLPNLVDDLEAYR